MVRRKKSVLEREENAMMVDILFGNPKQLQTQKQHNES